MMVADFVCKFGRWSLACLGYLFAGRSLDAHDFMDAVASFQNSLKKLHIRAHLLDHPKDRWSFLLNFTLENIRLEDSTAPYDDAVAGDWIREIWIKLPSTVSKISFKDGSAPRTNVQPLKF